MQRHKMENNNLVLFINNTRIVYNFILIEIKYKKVSHKFKKIYFSFSKKKMTEILSTYTNALHSKIIKKNTRPNKKIIQAVSSRRR